MKKILNAAVFLLVGVALTSCDDDNERFSGSPVGNLQIETLKGNITTDVTAALSGQKIDFVAHLPEGKTFADTVSVEISAYNKSGGRTRSYVIFEPGENEKEGDIESSGGVIFNSTIELKMTAIELYTVEPGKHYLIESDPVVIATGNSAIPSIDPERLTVRLVWPGASSSNNVRFFIDKPDGVADINVNSLTTGGKNHYITRTPTGSNNVTYSNVEGDYVLSITGISQSTPTDMPYRVILRYPNGDTEVFEGVYQGMLGTPTPSPLKPILKINKTGQGDAAVFTATTEGL